MIICPKIEVEVRGIVEMIGKVPCCLKQVGSFEAMYLRLGALVATASFISMLSHLTEVHCLRA